MTSKTVPHTAPLDDPLILRFPFPSSRGVQLSTFAFLVLLCVLCVNAFGPGSLTGLRHSASGWLAGMAFLKASSSRHSSLMRRIFGNSVRSTLKRLAFATYGTSVMSAKPGVSLWQNFPVSFSVARRFSSAVKPTVTQCRYQAFFCSSVTLSVSVR